MAWASVIKPLIRTATRSLIKGTGNILSKASSKISKVVKLSKGKQGKLDIFKENSSDISNIFESTSEENKNILDEFNKNDLPKKSESKSLADIKDEISDVYDIDFEDVSDVIDVNPEDKVQAIVDDSNERLKRSKKKLDEQVESKSITNQEYVDNLYKEFNDEQKFKLLSLNDYITESNNKVIEANIELAKKSIALIEHNSLEKSNENKTGVLDKLKSSYSKINDGIISLAGGEKQLASGLGENIKNSGVVQGLVGGVIEFIGKLDPMELIMLGVVLIVKQFQKLVDRIINPVKYGIINVKDTLLHWASKIPGLGSLGGYEEYYEYVEGTTKSDPDSKGNTEIIDHCKIEYRKFDDGTVKVVDVQHISQSELDAHKKSFKNETFINSKSYGKSIYNRNKENWVAGDNMLLSLREREMLPKKFELAEVKAEDKVAKGQSNSLLGDIQFKGSRDEEATQKRDSAVSSLQSIGESMEDSGLSTGAGIAEFNGVSRRGIALMLGSEGWFDKNSRSNLGKIGTTALSGKLLGRTVVGPGLTDSINSIVKYPVQLGKSYTEPQLWDNFARVVSYNTNQNIRNGASVEKFGQEGMDALAYLAHWKPAVAQRAIKASKNAQELADWIDKNVDMSKEGSGGIVVKNTLVAIIRKKTYKGQRYDAYAGKNADIEAYLDKKLGEESKIPVGIVTSRVLNNKAQIVTPNNNNPVAPTKPVVTMVNNQALSLIPNNSGTAAYELTSFNLSKLTSNNTLINHNVTQVPSTKIISMGTNNPDR